MRRVALTFAVSSLALAGLSAVPAAALDRPAEPVGDPTTTTAVPDENIATQAEVPETWTMTTVAGADGWVAPNEPLPIRITLTSELLLVGRVDISVGGGTTSQAIEVPAGGVKDYFIQALTPGQRRQLRVQLVADSNGAETTLESQTISLRVPADEVVVAAIGAEPYESSIRSATPEPVNQNVEIVRMSPAELGNLNSAISYLVLPNSAMAELGADQVEAVRRWVQDGGRLIADASNVSRVIDPAGGTAFSRVDAVGVPLGSGEVTAVNDFEAVDADGWSQLLRSVPQPGIVRVQEDVSLSSLVGSALSGRSASVPALPWLLLGILLFVVLVGPVNFIVLRGFGRPEWAWVTVPLLSAVFVAGFWIVGRSQLQPFTVTHSSVVVNSEGTAEGRTAFVLQVESGGNHELRMNDGWNSEAQNFGGVDSGVTKIDDAGRHVIEYELEDLGVGTAQGAWSGDAAGDIGFAVAPVATGLEVTVNNRSGMVFDTWGVVVDGLAFLASGELAGDADGTVTARTTNRRNNRYQPVIMEAVERRGFVGDDFYVNEYQQIYPMTVFAEQLAPTLTENAVHFFGFTLDAEYDLEINGSAAQSTGSTLMVLEVPDDGSLLAARTTARPQLLAVEGSSSVERYFEEIYAYGADAVVFHYKVPPGIASGSVNPGFTSLSVAEVYDWSVGDYVQFEWGDQIDLRRVTSPTGEVVVRAARGDDDRFFDESLSLSRFSLNWG